MWLSCSLSAECSSACSPAASCSKERLGCADNCMQEELSRTTTTISSRDTGGQLARLASNSGVMKQKMRVVMMMIVMMVLWGA